MQHILDVSTENVCLNPKLNPGHGMQYILDVSTENVCLNPKLNPGHGMQYILYQGLGFRV
jgi:hypothetical protein